MLAKLQFKDYQVTEIKYNFDPFRADADDELTPDFKYNIRRNPENRSQAWVFLSFSMGDQELKTSSFYISITVAGYFEVFGEDDEETILGFYKTNALAILYPYLRSIVSEITSKGTQSPLILPTLNIVALFEEMEQRGKIEAENDGE